MPAVDDQIIGALERRLAIVYEAPPERFRGELARYLEFIASSAALRAVVDATLAQETEKLTVQQAAATSAARECAARTSAIARELARALRPWLADGSLPDWVGPLLEGYDEERALAALGRGESPWGKLAETLAAADLCAGEVARLLREADDAAASGMLLRAAGSRAAEDGLSGTLARLWGHVRHAAPRALLPEWGGLLEVAAGQAWEQSSQALLRQALQAAPGDVDATLHAGLRHDLRRLTSTLVDGLEARPPALPALERFRRWCELYEREALLRKIRPGKKANDTVRRRKRALIVAEALRFLYSQGFTPLTLDMLEGEALPPEAPRRLLVEVRVVSEREGLLRGYVACVQALRASERARQLGLREAFLLAFLVEPTTRFVEPAPLSIGGMLLRSVFVDLTPPSSNGRQPLGVEAIAERIAEEDRLFEFLNTASEEALDSVAGVGASKVQQIIAGRPYGGAADLKRAGLPTAGVLYEALRARALRGMQTLVNG